MSHRLADKKYIGTGQMLILMFHFILGDVVIINMDSEYERNTWIATLNLDDCPLSIFIHYLFAFSLVYSF
ncbi:hypothetical protein ACYCS5_12840 [Paenibacillus sp. SEL3]|uniref:Uncharacterized protein n=1 Tax=Paenibacillus polymyxa TaxID=1406 RepID=A0A8I1LQA6_PAEPO|nr:MULTISPECIES: hypothetical protein [Paenibacillus]KAF6576126.1 hypothetical protein G9G53_05600 [Paenibacillus sp. EKM206P]KAF6589758.1 hypothetical protein G9G52_09485 [Paenibacillus sp. EKM205P]MBM0633474.1 hypothetical protein [Paenibacillus polymyxa]